MGPGVWGEHGQLALAWACRGLAFGAWRERGYMCTPFAVWSLGRGNIRALARGAAELDEGKREQKRLRSDTVRVLESHGALLQ